MDPARWKQVKNLYDAAAGRPIRERWTFLLEACQGDDDLRHEVQRLLDQPVDTDGLFGLVADGPTSIAPENVRDLTGTRLGVFEIRALIGRGGMGEVYRALDTKLARDVAIKVLPSAFTADVGRLASFEREARVLASLNHAHIAAIHGVEERDGIRGLVLELVEGETLADVLQRSETASGSGLRLQEVLGYAHQIAEALEAAHKKGITHRDLKPANIAITPDGVVKLLDFGIAKVVTGDGPGVDLAHTAHTTIEATLGGFIAGTAGYMSPEQARGRPVDHRTDIWAFGCVLYEMLSGRRAFAGETLSDTIAAILDDDPNWSRLPRDTPRAARRLMQRCLEKDLQQRLSDIGDARIELEQVLRGEKDGRRLITIRIARAAAAAAAAIAITAVAATFLRDRRPPGPEQWEQLTRFSDSVGQPSLSPDGKMVAFVRGATTFSPPGEIYVKTLPDGEAVQLTRDGLNKMSPAFSSDGSRIAYTVREGGKWNTWQVPLIGGQARPWLENASGLTWTAWDRLLFSEIKNNNLHMAIVTSRENRAEARDVYVPERVSDMAHRSYLSPDGKWVLVVEMANGPWVPCRLVSIDGQSPGRQVGPANAGCTFAAWAPDGKWMYLSSSAGGRSHIWRQPFPNGAPEQITFGPNEEDGISIAPDGRSFITAVASRQSSVWVHGQAGDRQISLEGFAFDPKFTPDGKKLLYRILKGASFFEASELRVADLETGGTEPLLPGVSIVGTPSVTYDVSEDGTQAVVAGVDGQGKSRVWLVPLDRRSSPRAIPDLKEEAFQPRFSANGEIFALVGPPSRQIAIRQDGTGLRKVSNTLGCRGLSPDGGWLITLTVITDERSGVTGRTLVARSLAQEADLLLVAPTAPSSLTEMTLKWSQDGRTVYFVSAALDRGMHTKTYAFPLAPGTMFPSIPPGGFRSEAEMAEAPGVKGYDVYDFAPGPAEGVYAFTRESVQRNLYRVPLR